MKRERRSAKEITTDYANELLNRTPDPSTDAKLLAIETIAYRMSWNELYNRLRYRKTQSRQPYWVTK